VTLAGEDLRAARNCATTTAATPTGNAPKMHLAIAPKIGLERAVHILVVLVTVWAEAFASPGLAAVAPNSPDTAAKMSFA
jgi:hypothetical protein